MAFVHVAWVVVATLLLSGCQTNAPSPQPESPADDGGAERVPGDTVSSSTQPSPAQSPGSEPGTTPATDANTTVVPEGRNWTTQPWRLAIDGWAPIEEALIFPGAIVVSWGGTCTVNFVFTDPNGTTVYVGTAGHCLFDPQGNGPRTELPETCEYVNTMPTGTQLTAFFGGNLDWNETYEAKGRYVYNSFRAMEGNETDSRICAANDFSIIEIDPEYRHLVNPTMGGHYGGYHGPGGMTSGEPADGSKIYTSGGGHERKDPGCCRHQHRRFGRRFPGLSPGSHGSRVASGERNHLASSQESNPGRGLVQPGPTALGIKLDDATVRRNLMMASRPRHMNVICSPVDFPEGPHG